MGIYQVVLSQAEDDALSYASVSQQDWIDNVVHDRCRIAIDEIIQLTVQKCIDNNIQIPNVKDDIVALAFQQGWVKTAAERQIDATPSE